MQFSKDYTREEMKTREVANKICAHFEDLVLNQNEVIKALKVKMTEEDVETMLRPIIDASFNNEFAKLVKATYELLDDGLINEEDKDDLTHLIIDLVPIEGGIYHKISEEKFKRTYGDYLVKSRKRRAAQKAANEKSRLWIAKLDKQGFELCGKCGGAGGFKEWPGFTCYRCNGKGYTQKEEWRK